MYSISETVALSFLMSLHVLYSRCLFSCLKLLLVHQSKNSWLDCAKSWISFDCANSNIMCCPFPPNSLSRASTMPRSTWVELVMRQSLLPRRRWFWGCLCETLHCRCHWIRRCTRMGLPIRGLRLLTYTKEGKKVTDSSALMYWENWPYINDLDVSIIVLYHCICFFSVFFFKSWRQVAQKSLFWCDHLVRCYLPNRNRDMHRHMLQFG